MGKQKRKRGDLSRREFLYVALGGTTGLLTVGTCGVLGSAFLPYRSKEGVDLFTIDPKTIPLPNTLPRDVPEGDFFLSNTDDGLYALCRACTHLHARVKWVATNERFECPAHGAKFKLSGDYIEGPANRGLDQFNIQVESPHGTQQTDNKLVPVNIEDATKIVVDVRVKILGKKHA